MFRPDEPIIDKLVGLVNKVFDISIEYEIYDNETYDNRICTVHMNSSRIKFPCMNRTKILSVRDNSWVPAVNKNIENDIDKNEYFIYNLSYDKLYYVNIIDYNNLILLKIPIMERKFKNNNIETRSTRMNTTLFYSKHYFELDKFKEDEINHLTNCKIRHYNRDTHKSSYEDVNIISMNCVIHSEYDNTEKCFNNDINSISLYYSRLYGGTTCVDGINLILDKILMGRRTLEWYLQFDELRLIITSILRQTLDNRGTDKMLFLRDNINWFLYEINRLAYKYGGDLLINKEMIKYMYTKKMLIYSLIPHLSLDIIESTMKHHTFKSFLAPLPVFL